MKTILVALAFAAIPAGAAEIAGTGGSRDGLLMSTLIASALSDRQKAGYKVRVRTRPARRY